MNENWRYVPFCDAVEICDTLRKPINSKERAARITGKTQEELYPYYGATGQVGYIDGYLTDGEYVLLGEDGAPFLDMYAKKAYIISGKSWVNNHAHVLRSKSNNKFLCFYLNYFNYKGYVSGTTRLKLTQAQMKRIMVPVPSEDEQERVVAKIEELFSELDNGVETLEKTLDKVERYKYSVIDSVLPIEHRKRIGECIEDMGQGWSPKCEPYNVVDDESWAVIKTTAIQPCDFLFEENKALPISLSPREKHEIKVGDILITRAGPKSRCGVCCMVKKTKKRLLNCDKVYRLRLNQSIVLPQYLEYVLNSPAFLKEINLCKTGGNDSGLNLTQTRFLSIEIPVPTVEEQKYIVNEIESRRSVCQSIENTVNTALQQAESMRQSILKKAFEGEL